MAMVPEFIDTLYQPNFTENSKQSFVAAFKRYVNGAMEQQLSELFSGDVEPEFRGEFGRKPATIDEAKPLLEQEYLYQLWGSMVYTSQDLLWETVGNTVDRLRPKYEAMAGKLASKTPLGSLHLNPNLELPTPISSVEIHRQPGGYFYEKTSQDLTAPLQYFASIELYRKAKGLSSGAKTGEPGMTRFMINALKEKFPDLQPKRILDLGCAVGTETIGLKEAFPNAEIYGVDISAPFLRFAHLWAECKQTSVHFRQADARDTQYPDEHFDLIISHILFHETWDDILPDIMSEANRILATGGVFFNADVPYQPARMPMTKQITNAWQIAHNGEPFWGGFVNTDIPNCLEKAGFDGSQIFDYYVPLGQGDYYFFGAKK